MKFHSLTLLFAAVLALTFGSAVLATASEPHVQADTASRTARVTASYQDMAIATKVKSALFGSQDVQVRHIDVSSKKGVVNLTGQVATHEGLAAVERIVRGIQGVNEVENALVVKENTAF